MTTVVSSTHQELWHNGYTRYTRMNILDILERNNGYTRKKNTAFGLSIGVGSQLLEIS